MRRRFSLVLLIAALMSAPLAASARSPSVLSAEITPDRSVNYSYWTVEGPTVRVRFVVPTGEARDLAAPGAPPPTLAAVSSAVGAGLAVSAGGQGCEAIDQGEGVGTVYTMALTPRVERFELIFRCPSADGIVLHDHLLFDRAPGHVDYALIQRGGASALRTFTAGRQDVALPMGALADEGAGDFAWRALVGTVRAVESLCLVAGLLLLCRRWRDLGFVAAGLGVGYGVSLALALSGLVAAGAPLIAIGLDGLVMLSGGGALYLQSRRSAADGRGGWVGAALFSLFCVAATLAAALIYPQAGLIVGGLAIFGCAWLAGAGSGASSSWLAPALAVVFGLLDGMRPASDLAPLHLAPLRLAPMLAGYDVGAMAAILAVMAVAMGSVRLAARRAAFARSVAEDLAGAGVLGFGVFWFVSHIYSC
jgi:hypothetical protein